MGRFKRGGRAEGGVLKKGEGYLGQRAERSHMQACYPCKQTYKRGLKAATAGLDGAVFEAVPSSSVGYLHRLLSGYTGSLPTNTGSCQFSWLPNQK